MVFTNWHYYSVYSLLFYCYLIVVLMEECQMKLGKLYKSKIPQFSSLYFLSTNQLLIWIVHDFVSHLLGKFLPHSSLNWAWLNWFPYTVSYAKLENPLQLLMQTTFKQLLRSLNFQLA